MTETCKVLMAYGKPCGKELYDDEHCIFHSNGILVRKEAFADEFWKEYERQMKHEEVYDFTGFIFPNKEKRGTVRENDQKLKKIRGQRRKSSI